MQTEILQTASYHHVTKAAIGGANFENDDLYMELVANTRKELESMGPNARLAVEAAYIFSRKVPHNERQDLFQELTAAILESGTENPAFAYTIARRDWQNWYRSYKLHSQYHEGRLSETLVNAEGEETELAELLIGEIEFEAKQIDKLDARALWAQIPRHIQRLALKRLTGKPLGTSRNGKRGKPKAAKALDNTERSQLNRWVKSEGYRLLIN